MTLRNRCEKFLAPYRVGMEPADHRDADALEAFVLSEIGRAASDRLAESDALVLFFASSEGGRTVVDAIMEAYPGLVARSWPEAG